MPVLRSGATSIAREQGLLYGSPGVYGQGTVRDDRVPMLRSPHLWRRVLLLVVLGAACVLAFTSEPPPALAAALGSILLARFLVAAAAYALMVGALIPFGLNLKIVIPGGGSIEPSYPPDNGNSASGIAKEVEKLRKSDQALLSQASMLGGLLGDATERTRKLDAQYKELIEQSSESQHRLELLLAQAQVAFGGRDDSVLLAAPWSEWPIELLACVSAGRAALEAALLPSMDSSMVSTVESPERSLQTLSSRLAALESSLRDHPHVVHVDKQSPSTLMEEKGAQHDT